MLTSINLVPALALLTISAVRGHVISVRQATPTPGLIDVHSHFIPDFYRTLLGSALPGGNPLQAWNAKQAIADQDRLNITRQILTPPTPNILFNNASLTASTAFQLNEYAANLSRTYPDRFSFFGVLPLPFVEETLAEIEHISTLGAVGFATFSNSEGIYPGDPRYAPVWDAINQTNKTVFIHPATPYLNIPCAGYVEANPLANVTVVSTLEFFADTARAFSDLFFRDVVRNYTNIRFLVPQVGGDLPATLDRTLGYLVGFLRQPSSTIDYVYDVIRNRFFYESAGPSYPHQVYGILGYNVSWSQMMFGTDYGAVPVQVVNMATGQFKNFTGFGSDQTRDDVYRNNAANLWSLS